MPKVDPDVTRFSTAVSSDSELVVPFVLLAPVSMLSGPWGADPDPWAARFLCRTFLTCSFIHNAAYIFKVKTLLTDTKMPCVTKPLLSVAAAAHPIVGLPRRTPRQRVPGVPDTLVPPPATAGSVTISVTQLQRAQSLLKIIGRSKIML